MKVFGGKKKYYLIFAIFIVSFVVFLGVEVRSFGYAVQYGGRIVETIPLVTCSTPIYGALNCPLCGQGPWHQVVVQPSGGSGFYFCPTFLAQKGNNPAYAPGGYVVTGGAAMNALDPMNTAAVLGKSSVRGNIMLAWFRLLDLLS